MKHGYGSCHSCQAITAALTVNAGLRWEYETPISELRSRLVNLDIAAGFASVAPVIGNDFVHPDRAGVQPRVSFAWRPIAASSRRSRSKAIKKRPQGSRV